MTKFLKQLQTYAKAERAKGMWSEAEIRRATDVLEGQLEQEDRAAATAEYAPPGTTPRQLAAANLERAFTVDKLDLLPAEAEPSDLGRELTKRRIAAINLERASAGQPPVSASELADKASEPDTGPETAPRGMNAVRRARENLMRACNGLPPLLPGDDE